MDMDAGTASSDAGSAIAVGTSEEVAIIRNIEDGAIYEDADYSQDDTRSLTSSVRQHIVDGGFRYHAYHAGRYAFPNDEHEQYRDDLKHSLTLHLCDGAFFFAPVHDMLAESAKVLDLGKLRTLTMQAGCFDSHVSRYRNGQVGYRQYVES